LKGGAGRKKRYSTIREELDQCIMLSDAHRSRKRLVGFPCISPARLSHEDFPEIDDRQTKLLTQLAYRLGVHLCGSSYSSKLYSRVGKHNRVLIDRRWGNEDDAGLVCYDQRMRDDCLEVSLVLGYRYMLLVRGVRERCIVGAKEDIHKPDASLVWRRDDARQHLQCHFGVVPAEAAVDDVQVPYACFIALDNKRKSYLAHERRERVWWVRV
jgi:hypothetical protein